MKARLPGGQVILSLRRSVKLLEEAVDRVCSWSEAQSICTTVNCGEAVRRPRYSGSR